MRCACTVLRPRFPCPLSPQAEAAKTTVRLALEKVKALQDDLSSKAQVCRTGAAGWRVQGSLAR